MSIGTKIRELRMAKGMTQSELGAGLVTPSMISQIESDKANPSYKVLEELAERLETPIEQFLTDVQTQIEKRITHKIAKAMIASQKYVQAAQILKEIMNDLELSEPIEARLDLGECYLQIGQYQEARDLYQQVIEIAEKKNEPLFILHALNKFGQLEQNRQKYHLAVFHWRKAYEMSEYLPESEPFLQSQILTNLGFIHQLLGEFEDSQMYYSKAYKLLINTTNYEQMGSVYLGLAQNYKVAGFYEKAAEYAQHAVSLSNIAQNVKFAIKVKRNYAMMIADNGKAQESLKLLNECLDRYLRYNLLEDVAIVYREIAHLHFKQRNFDECLRMCDLALNYLDNDAKPRASVLHEKALAQNELGLLDDAILLLETSVKLYKSHALLTDLSQALAFLV